MRLLILQLTAAAIFPILFTSCAGFFSDTGTTRDPLQAEIEAVKRIANYDMNNVKVMRNPDEWVGKMISLSGTVLSQPILGEVDEVFELRGTNDGFLTDMIIRLDQPLPRQSNIGEAIKLVSQGKEVRVFGIMNGLKSIRTDSGTRRELPEIRCQIIYDRNDFYLSRPLWTSRELEVKAAKSGSKVKTNTGQQ